MLIRLRNESLQSFGPATDNTALVSKLQSELERSTRQLEEMSQNSGKEEEEQQLFQLQKLIEEQKKKNLAFSDHIAKVEREHGRKEEENELAKSLCELIKAEEGKKYLFPFSFGVTDALVLAQQKLLDCANESEVNQLVDMGFAKEMAQKALLITGRGVSVACEW